MLLYTCGLTFKTVDSTSNDVLTHFELMNSSVSTDGVNVTLCIIYRPPPSKRNEFKNSVFFDEWNVYLDSLVVITMCTWTALSSYQTN